MKRSRIEIIRESMERVVALLAKRDIPVTQRGMKAYVSYHRVTGEIMGVNLPYLPDDASETLVAAVQGFLDHEVGHILHTDPEIVKLAAKERKFVAQLHNMIEDVYVERRMAEQFPGSHANLESLRVFFFDELVLPNIHQALAAGAERAAHPNIMMMCMRAWGGQAKAAVALLDPAIAPIAERLKSELPPVLFERLPLLRDSAECLDLARLVGKLVAEPPKPKPEPKPEPEHSPPPDEDEEPPEDEGEGEGESGPGGQPSAADDDGDGDESPGEGPGEDPGEDPGERPAGRDEAEEGDETEKPGSSTNPPEPTDAEKAIEESKDFDDMVAEALSKSAKEVAGSTPYKVFSNDWDTERPAPTGDATDAEAQRLDELVRPMVGVMAQKLRMALASRSRVGYTPGKRSGVLDASALFRVSLGDDRVFKQRHVTHSARTRVTLLIDCSASMDENGRITKAAQAAYALSRTLETLKIEHEVLGFTATPNAGMSEAIMKETGTRDIWSAPYGRVYALDTLVFKSFKEKLDMTVKKRLAHLASSPSWLYENVDGESVQVAARRLLKGSSADRHLLLVLSDGEPCCPPANGLGAHLKKVVASLAPAIEVIGIGIQSSAVSRFYPNHLVLHDVASLPRVVVGELSKMLLRASPAGM